MTYETTRTAPVLIAGAGPAGLTAAITLARQGIESLVVERKRELSSLPRATVISTRSMELFRSWGLTDALRAGGVEVEWKMLACESLALASAGAAIPVGLPSREQSALISPAAPECVPQDHTERVLLDHLRSLGRARVLLGTEVVGLEQGDDGARVVLRAAEGGPSSVVHARYVIAADGAHSTVRAHWASPCTVPTGTSTPPRRSSARRSGTCSAPVATASTTSAIRRQRAPSCRPASATAGCTACAGSRVEQSLAEYTAARFTHLIRLATGVADLQPRIERIGGFSFAAQLAERFRSGSVFLVGDAAHRVSPRGGTGMNTAIHDGFDLGWKLAWVLRGWAGPGLLDSYERERRPVAEHNLARSIDPNGSVRDVGRELQADLGDRIPHVWVPTRAGLVSTLDLLGPGLTLFTGSRSGRWEGGARLCARSPARRRAAPRRHQREGTRHPRRRCAARAPRRRAGRLVVERDGRRAGVARRRPDRCSSAAARSGGSARSLTECDDRHRRFPFSSPTECSRGGSTCSV